MEQDGRDVEPVGAGHAVFTVVAGDRVELHHQVGGLLQEGELLVRERVERAVGGEIVLQVLHAGHAAQYGQHPGERPRKTEGPRGDAPFGFALLEARHDVVGHVREAPAQQRFHDDGRDAALLQLAVEVLGIGVPLVDLLGVAPVEVVELDLHEIPLVAIVFGEHAVEHADVAVVGEPEVADTPGLAFGQQEIEHAVVDVAGFELLHAVAAHADAVQQQVVDVVGPEFAERVAVHLHRGFAAPRCGREVRQFGGDVVALARIAGKRRSRGPLGESA